MLLIVTLRAKLSTLYALTNYLAVLARTGVPFSFASIAIILPQAPTTFQPLGYLPLFFNKVLLMLPSSLYLKLKVQHSGAQNLFFDIRP